MSYLQSAFAIVAALFTAPVVSKTDYHINTEYKGSVAFDQLKLYKVRAVKRDIKRLRDSTFLLSLSSQNLEIR